MLVKLTKYGLKDIYKILIIFYIPLLFIISLNGSPLSIPRALFSNLRV